MAECGLLMLSSLAEEVANLDSGRRADLAAKTEAVWGQVVAATQQLAAAAGAAGPGGYALLHGALQCFHAWLRLSDDAVATTRASPGEVRACRL